MTNAEFKSLREALGLTSRDLAGLIGVRQATVTGWEAGIRPIPDRRAEQLRSLADDFDKQVNYLTAEAGYTIRVPRNDDERKDTTMPARWQRRVALTVARKTGKRIEYFIPYAQAHVRKEKEK